MNESESLFSPPPLPPKRRPSIGPNPGSDSVESSTQGRIDEEFFEESEIDPELLAAFAEAAKETGNEVIIDIPVRSKSSTVTAPILENYIDPHTVPIQYLLEQARAPRNAGLVEQDSTDKESVENK